MTVNCSLFTKLKYTNCMWSII